tara:strand:- start:4274 stop:4951 length:678 start_codon:yes stop_codon:yes gene_type:complete
MFDIVRKEEYFECLAAGHATESNITLKGIQDGWTLKQLANVKGKRIMEVGGGDSRILPLLDGNERWNVDKFEGVGQGPTKAQEVGGVTVIRSFLGEFDAALPCVDIIFSISVIEHIPFAAYADTFADMARCLLPGGRLLHTIDLPLSHVSLSHSDERIRLLRDAVEGSGLSWMTQPVIAPGQMFESDMASNSDVSAYRWTKICDVTKRTAPLNQLVTLKLIAEKT